MNLWSFMKDRGLLLLLHLLCMCVAMGFLRATGYNTANCMLLFIFWIIVLTGWLFVTYYQRKKFFKDAERVTENLDQRYLLGELLPKSFLLEDRLYREMILKSNKSVIERIRRIEQEQKDYREYIESWVHEIKAPITGIATLCNNRRKSNPGETVSAKEKEDFLAISLENERIENYVDMALYYARSEEVYKDYLIRQVELNEIVYEVLEKNRLLLIKNQVRAEVECEDTVYTDRKWIAFILNQMILNCVKYRNESPVLRIYSMREKNGVKLVLEDNGVGIRKEELSRIFEKGFTGSNGRNHEKATGMGLYLCQKLCDKLGIGLNAESEYGRGTRMFLEFPISNYINGEKTD